MDKPEGVEDLDSVESVKEYQGSYADFSAILNRASSREVRVHYLENLRDEWEWKDSHVSDEYDNGHVQFKRKE